MSGLLLKDMLNLKKSMIFILAIAVLWGVGGSGEYVGLFAPLAVFYFSYAVTSSAASTDENCGWNKLETAFPLSRRRLVAERYLLGVISLAAGAVVLILVRLAMSALFGMKSDMLGMTLPAVLFGVSSGLILNAVMLPLQMKFGYVKSRLVSVLIFGAVTGISAALVSAADAGDTVTDASSLPLGTLFFVLLVCAAVDFVSYLAAVKIYEKREL